MPNLTRRHKLGRLLSQARWLLAKRCDHGKPCGGSCISKSKQCKAEPGKIHPNDAPLRKLFSGPGHVQVSNTFDPDVTAQAMFGRVLTGEELSGLAGASSDSTTSVRGYPSAMRFDVNSPHVSIQVRHLSKIGSAVVLENASLTVVDSAPDGLGTHIFTKQVQTARKLGVTKIITEAGGQKGSVMNGYYTWPRLGYNAPLSITQIARLPASLESARTVLDLMQTPEGRAWWSDKGRKKKMEFDLSDGSRSLKVLNSYMEEKGFTTRVD